MGNCFKKASLITDKYLFEPLNNSEENMFDNSDKDIIKEGCICFDCKEKVNELFEKVNELNNKITILDENTRSNLKSLSEDIYYIHEKSSDTTNSEYASFINDNN